MKGEQLSRMLQLATSRHEGQFDKGGNPYILHPLKVMHYTKSSDEEIQCIAVGHDLIEDTYKTVGEGAASLRYHGFSDRVIDGIVALTKVPGEPYEAYKSRVKANPDAVIVKMADLRHNTDIRRLKGKTVTDKDIARSVRYWEFYLELEEIRKSNGISQQYEGDSTMTEQNQTPDVKLQRTLFPQPHQLVIGKIKGGSYLGSLWIGFTMPIFNLPLMLWHQVLLPAGAGLLFIAKTFIVAAMAGLMGRAHGFLVDMPKRGE